jgi:hypothetical protein
MAQVASNITTKDKIGQNTLDFIQINWHAQPFKGFGDMIQRYLMTIEDQVYSLEQVAITNRFAFLQQQVCSLSVKSSMPATKSICNEYKPTV